MEIIFTEIEKVDLPHRLKWLNDKKVNQYLGHQVRKGTEWVY